MRSSLTRYRLVLGLAAMAAVVTGVSTTGAARWLWLATLCTLTGLTVGLGVSFPQWQMFGESLCRARTGRRLVSLTFDDGPDPENTPALLELLAERKTCATFFCIGNRVAGQRDLIRRMVAGGHAVENHTLQHNPWTNLFSVARLRKEVSRAQEEIRCASGRAPEFFRPPMGLTNGRVFRVADELGLRVTGYTARGLDRRTRPPEQIARRLLRGLRPGAIFLLHDGGVPRERLLAVVKLVLDALQTAGYQCVRLDRLMAEHETNC